MTERLIERTADRTVYEADDGALRYEWATPLHDRAAEALAGLNQLADSTGTLTGLQLSNAVRLLARVVVALVRLRVRRREDDPPTKVPNG